MGEVVVGESANDRSFWKCRRDKNVKEKSGCNNYDGICGCGNDRKAMGHENGGSFTSAHEVSVENVGGINVWLTG